MSNPRQPRIVNSYSTNRCTVLLVHAVCTLTSKLGDYKVPMNGLEPEKGYISQTQILKTFR